MFGRRNDVQLARAVNNKNEKPAVAEPTWIPTSRLVPKDGQSVFAKGRYDPTPRQVTFRRSPAPRWEEGDTVYQFERFDYWAPIPSKMK